MAYKRLNSKIDKKNLQNSNQEVVKEKPKDGRLTNEKISKL